MFDAEISTSRPLFEYGRSILSVWVNHVIIRKGMILYYQQPKKQRN